MLRAALTLFVCASTGALAGDPCVRDDDEKLVDANDRSTRAAIDRALEKSGLRRQDLHANRGDPRLPPPPGRPNRNPGRWLHVGDFDPEREQRSAVVRNAEGHLELIEFDVRPRYTKTVRVCGCAPGGGGFPNTRAIFVRLEGDEEARLGTRDLVVHPAHVKLVYSRGSCPPRP